MNTNQSVGRDYPDVSVISRTLGGWWLGSEKCPLWTSDSVVLSIRGAAVFNDAVRTGEDQTLVTVPEPHDIRRPAVVATHFDDLAELFAIGDMASVDAQVISHRGSHRDHLPNQGAFVGRKAVHAPR